MSGFIPTIEQFRKELLLIKVIYIKLLTFVTNETKCKAAGYDYYYHYVSPSNDVTSDYIQHAYYIGFDQTNPMTHHYEDYLCVTISKHTEKIYCIQATCHGEIFKNFFKRALKHYNKIVTNDVLNIFSDINCKVGDARYFICSCFETSHESTVDGFDPISAVNDIKLGFAYMYLFPDACIGLYNNKADMSALTFERLSLFNNLLDDFIKGIKNNTYIT